MRSGKEVDKFEQMKLTPLESRFVKAPGIAESPVNIECRVTQIIELGSHHMFLAEVAGVTVDKEYLNRNQRLELGKCGLMVYSHGEYYGLGKKIGTFGYSVRKRKKRKRKEELNRHSLHRSKSMVG